MRMKPSTTLKQILLLIVFFLLAACDKVTIEIIPPKPVPKAVKPAYPVQLGTIRGYFDNDYKTFRDHIEKVAPIDSFSNCFFYGGPSNTLRQINLIRCDTTYVVAFYINGVSPDSISADIPATTPYSRYFEMQFYKFQDWNNTSTDSKNFHFTLGGQYGSNVLITSNKGDTLTGTFQGDMISPSGNVLRVKDGEFKIKIFRKFMRWQ
jgi:hypothetical protein